MGNRHEEGREGIGAEEQMQEVLKETFSRAIDALRRKGTEESILFGMFKDSRADGYIIGPDNPTSPAAGVTIMAGGNLESAKKVEIWINGGVQGPSRLTLRRKTSKGQKEEVTGRVETWNETLTRSRPLLKGRLANEFKILNVFSNAISKI